MVREERPGSSCLRGVIQEGAVGPGRIAAEFGAGRVEPRLGAAERRPTMGSARPSDVEVDQQPTVLLFPLYAHRPEAARETSGFGIADCHGDSRTHGRKQNRLTGL